MPETTNEDIQSSVDRLVQEVAANPSNAELARSLTHILENQMHSAARLERIEHKLDPTHKDYILMETNKKVDQLWALFMGLTFSGRAIKYTAGIVFAIGTVIVSLFALIRFVK